MSISSNELKELKEKFNDVINYENDDPCAPIDPLTYTAPDGDNCLHIAIWRNDFRAVQLLMKAGLNVNKKGDMGETPLHIAIRKNNGSIIKSLISAGAKTDIISEFGKSPQDEADIRGIDLEIIK